MKDIIEYYEKVKDILPDIENEEKQMFQKFTKKDKLWSQVGVLRTVLDITNERYFEERCMPGMPDDVRKLLSKWRKKADSSKNSV